MTEKTLSLVRPPPESHSSQHIPVDWLSQHYHNHLSRNCLWLRLVGCLILLSTNLTPTIAAATRSPVATATVFGASSFTSRGFLIPNRQTRDRHLSPTTPTAIPTAISNTYTDSDFTNDPLASQPLQRELTHVMTQLYHKSTDQSGRLVGGRLPYGADLARGVDATKLLLVAFTSDGQIIRRFSEVPTNPPILNQQFSPFLVLYLRRIRQSLFTIPVTSEHETTDPLFQSTTFMSLNAIDSMRINTTVPENGNRPVQNGIQAPYGTTIQRPRRVRRSLRDQNPSDRKQPRRSKGQHPRKICSRRPMFVDFDQIGWHQWIILPKRYDAGICTGQCPFPMAQAFSPTNHAVVQLYMHLLQPGGQRIRRPCCVAHRMQSLQVLHHDQTGQVILEAYEEMVVQTCRCL